MIFPNFSAVKLTFLNSKVTWDVYWKTIVENEMWLSPNWQIFVFLLFFFKPSFLILQGGKVQVHRTTVRCQMKSTTSNSSPLTCEQLSLPAVLCACVTSSQEVSMTYPSKLLGWTLLFITFYSKT